MGVISIPKEAMGHTLQEATVKAALRRMNPGIDFDLGSRLNLWHPFRDTRQSVLFEGRFICAMDRGTLPELTVWSMMKDVVEVPVSDIHPGELAFYRTVNVRITCLKCKGQWDMPHRPDKILLCLCGCDNRAHSADLTHWAYQDVPTGTALVRRSVKDRVILVGWRHTFKKILGFMVPGITEQRLELTFNITLQNMYLEDEPEIIEGGEYRALDQSLSI